MLTALGVIAVLQLALELHLFVSFELFANRLADRIRAHFGRR